MGENIRDPAALPPRPAADNRHDPPGFDSGRFNQGRRYQNLRSQGSQTWLLFFTLQGGGYFRSADGRSAELAGPGDAHLFRPRAFQEYGTRPGASWTFHWAHFLARPAWTAWLAWPPVKGIAGLSRLHLAAARTRRQLVEAFADLHRDVRLPGAWRAELAANALERIFLLLREGAGESGRPADPRVQAAVERIVTRPAERYTVDALAREVHLSPSRFAHLFRAQTGTSVIEAVLRARLREAAQQLLLTPSSIKEIADDLGFATPYYFSSQFRRRYGMSPRAWRAGGGGPATPR